MRGVVLTAKPRRLVDVGCWHSLCLQTETVITRCLKRASTILSVLDSVPVVLGECSKFRKQPPASSTSHYPLHHGIHTYARDLHGAREEPHEWQTLSKQYGPKVDESIS